ncbi:hypothetical protein FEM48_Zijuj03G0096700 [Ziziphus jujuba var. spinosa]|uniref:Bifunctional inhibitor/plant lipid transfer protein/seed storage helical domain-containing protein n=1 Tax=Ziziphus jujuba var. spinosa TaxID=714518 RepID=A0A978VPJ8_ZIZJJ|nr:hypothetical protein FEM48_Zijuj03G0096700 [Ziziphus jujuba var. spinosa]
MGDRSLYSTSIVWTADGITAIMDVMSLRIKVVIGLFLLLHHWECGKSSAESVLDKLAPCDAAAQDKNAKVSRKCYNEVKIFGKHRLCAIILSTEAESLGIKPEAAMSTIPKRCKFSKRPMGGPVGYKRGGYTVP